MTSTEKLVAAVIGGIMGIALSGYLLVYVPMMANIEERGCPFLECNASTKEARP